MTERDFPVGAPVGTRTERDDIPAELRRSFSTSGEVVLGQFTSQKGLHVNNAKSERQRACERCRAIASQMTIVDLAFAPSESRLELAKEPRRGSFNVVERLIATQDGG